MASLYDIGEILHYQNIGRMYRELSGGLAPNPFLDFYTGGTPDQEPTDLVKFPSEAAVKKAAPLGLRNAPSKSIDPHGLSERELQLIHAHNNLKLDYHSMAFLREPESSELQMRGRVELRRQADYLRKRHLQTRRKAFAKLMTTGIIYVDQDGEILESDTGNIRKLDFGVPAGHKDQLDYDGTGAIIGTKWDDAAAKILDDLDDIKIAAEAENAEPPKHIWLHDTSKRWFRDNTQLKAYLERNQTQADIVLRGDMVEVGGYVFHFFSGTYETDAGTNTNFIPTTHAIITPEPGDWFANIEGRQFVPTDLNVKVTPEEALGATAEVWGDFSYVKLLDDPVTLQLHAGMNFLYAFRNPKSVWIATVIF